MKNGFPAVISAADPGTVHVGTTAPGCPVEQSSTGFRSGSMRVALARFQKAGRRLLTQLSSFPPILTATLREIFDESAYARFLDQRQLVSSRAAYAAFRQEHETAKARRPKCC